MNDEQKAAYIIAQAACAQAEIAAMQAENQSCACLNKPPVYGQANFLAIPDKYGIHHNSVLTLFGN